MTTNQDVFNLLALVVRGIGELGNDGAVEALDAAAACIDRFIECGWLTRQESQLWREIKNRVEDKDIRDRLFPLPRSNHADRD